MFSIFDDDYEDDDLYVERSFSQRNSGWYIWTILGIVLGVSGTKGYDWYNTTSLKLDRLGALELIQTDLKKKEATIRLLKDKELKSLKQEIERMKPLTSNPKKGTK